jgi:hypothetical protein
MTNAHRHPGILTGGLLPSVAHALNHLLEPSAPGPLVLPAGLEVLAQPVAVSSDACRDAGARAFADVIATATDCMWHGNEQEWGRQEGQAAEAATGAAAALATSATEGARQKGAGLTLARGKRVGLEVDCLDLSDLESLRWCPSQSLPAPLAPCALERLAPPTAVWAFDCLAPPDGAGAKELDVTFEGSGSVDAVAVWARVRLLGDITLTTGGVLGGCGCEHVAASPAWMGEIRQIVSRGCCTAWVRGCMCKPGLRAPSGLSSHACYQCASFLNNPT